jgi:hypothetical protein
VAYAFVGSNPALPTLLDYLIHPVARAIRPLPRNAENGNVLSMPTVALKAHFDGERIILDEPFNLPEHAPLMVTVLPSASEPELETEEAWLRAAAASEAFAFLADPAEDIYTPEDGQPLGDAI